jgi:hypothetical protein
MASNVHPRGNAHKATGGKVPSQCQSHVGAHHHLRLNLLEQTNGLAKEYVPTQLESDYGVVVVGQQLPLFEAPNDVAVFANLSRRPVRKLKPYDKQSAGMLARIQPNDMPSCVYVGRQDT